VTGKNRGGGRRKSKRPRALACQGREKKRCLPLPIPALTKREKRVWSFAHQCVGRRKKEKKLEEYPLARKERVRRGRRGIVERLLPPEKGRENSISTFNSQPPKKGKGGRHGAINHVHRDQGIEEGKKKRAVSHFARSTTPAKKENDLGFHPFRLRVI